MARVKGGFHRQKSQSKNKTYLNPHMYKFVVKVKGGGNMGTRKTFALILGIVLAIVGILGFFDNGIVGEAGFFGTNMYQDVLHLVAAAFGIYAGTKGEGDTYNKTIGWISLALGILGFIPGISDLFLSLLNINTNITVLHLVIGVVCLWVGYKGK